MSHKSGEGYISPPPLQKPWIIRVKSIYPVLAKWKLLDENPDPRNLTRKGQDRCFSWNLQNHRNKTRKRQDHWFLPNQWDFSLFAALILLWYWNNNCLLQTNNLSSHWLGQNYKSCPFLVTFLWTLPTT